MFSCSNHCMPIPFSKLTGSALQTQTSLLVLLGQITQHHQTFPPRRCSDTKQEFTALQHPPLECPTRNAKRCFSRSLSYFTNVNVKYYAGSLPRTYPSCPPIAEKQASCGSSSRRESPPSPRSSGAPSPVTPMWVRMTTLLLTSCSCAGGHSKDLR